MTFTTLQSLAPSPHLPNPTRQLLFLPATGKKQYISEAIANRNWQGLKGWETIKKQTNVQLI